MYDFENKDKIPFNELSGDQMKIVVSSDKSLVESLIGTVGWGGKVDMEYHPDSVYRVKSAPYTLEDALYKVRAESEEAAVFPHSEMVIPTSVAMSIITELAASMEASK